MTYPASKLEIIVIDSHSKQAGAGVVTTARNARYIPHPDAGVAAARNAGARLASGELLMFVDDDIVVRKDTLSQHEAIHCELDRCFVSGRWEFDPQLRAALAKTPLGRYRLRYEDLYNVPHGIEHDAQCGRVYPVTLAASNLSVRRDVFWTLDGFDERFPVGAEDQDLTWRARKAGCTLVYDYDIPVVHNDQHGDLAALCERLERGAMGAVFFVGTNSDAPPSDLLSLNGPLHRTDPPRVLVRKLLRGSLSGRFPLAVAHRLVRCIELLRPHGGWPLEQSYTALAGLHVFRGTRRGVELTRQAQRMLARSVG